MFMEMMTLATLRGAARLVISGNIRPGTRDTLQGLLILPAFHADDRLIASSPVLELGGSMLVTLY